MNKVYIIKNKINGKVYIGATSKTLEERFYQHKNKAKNGSKTYLHNAIRTYGEENFTIELIESFQTREEMFESEIEYVKKFESFGKGYNLTLGGESVLTVKYSDEEILKVYKKHKSSVKAAKELGIGENTVIRSVKALDFPLYGSGYEASKRVSSEEVLKSFKKHRSYDKVANELDISLSTVGSKLKSYNIYIGYLEEEIIELSYMYTKDKKSLTNISEETGINRKTLSKLFKHIGVALEVRGRHLVPIIAIINGEELYFDSKSECINYIIDKNLTKSKKEKTVREGIDRSIRVSSPYYGMTFIIP